MSFIPTLFFDYIMLLVKDSSVLLQVRCHCTSGVGWCVWKYVEWAAYTKSTYSVCSCVRYVIV